MNLHARHAHNLNDNSAGLCLHKNLYQAVVHSYEHDKTKNIVLSCKTITNHKEGPSIIDSDLLWWIVCYLWWLKPLQIPQSFYSDPSSLPFFHPSIIIPLVSIEQTLDKRKFICPFNVSTFLSILFFSKLSTNKDKAGILFPIQLRAAMRKWCSWRNN